MRVDQVVAALVSARGGDRAGEVDDLGEKGSAMPILKGWPCPRPPKLAMSPAAFTIAPQMPLARNAPSARCAALWGSRTRLLVLTWASKRPARTR
jgi:hypothetical protein